MKEILQQFALANEAGEITPLKTGIINDSYIARAATEGGTSYFLQRINHHIFTDVDGLQENIKKVTEHIREKLQKQGVRDVERRTLHIVPTKEGKLYYRTEKGDCWRVYDLIEDTESMDVITADSAYLTGRAFGEFQYMLSDLPPEELTETIPHFHDIVFRVKQLLEAMEEDKAGQLRESAILCKTLLMKNEEIRLMERLEQVSKLPIRINHCDTKVNNILFDKEGKPLCIVDLDTVMPGYVLSDYGDFMRTAANTGREDEKNLEAIDVNMEVFRSYTKGYLETATFLTEEEKALLPFGVLLMTYMQAIRFFTDWLNGDTYYKILYPEHNLVRTRAQLRLLEKQTERYEEMQTTVQEYSHTVANKHK